MTNLLINAAKYTPDGGKIALTVAADAKRERLVISVRDSGLGMTPEMLTRAFDIFVQADESEDRREGGLGIGLNIVRRIIELHGGRVSAQSDGPNRGSTFTIELPLAAREAA